MKTNLDALYENMLTGMFGKSEERPPMFLEDYRAAKAASDRRKEKFSDLIMKAGDKSEENRRREAARKMKEETEAATAAIRAKYAPDLAPDETARQREEDTRKALRELRGKA